MKYSIAMLAVAGLGALERPAAGAETAWRSLLATPGSLDGFRQLGGKATYELKDGVLTGTSVAREPNSFLATEMEFADFDLEYEFKVDDQLNSGVQIRSHSRPAYHNGQVHGYQVEIDPSPRAWTAGVYDEGRRGWLQSLVGNDAARGAFKHSDWNTVRVEAVGDSLKTWLNGVPAADLRDAMEQSGFIAFQVHGIGNDEKAIGTQVHWRQIRVHDRGRHEWKPIFDGVTLTGWKPTPGGTWEVRDGVIHGTSPASDPRHGLLLSEADFGDFTIRLKFKVTHGNSGLYFRCQRVDDPVTVHGFQAEICENDDTGGLYETGGRGWVAQTDKATMTKEAIYQPGQWNEMWVSAHGQRVVVHLNGHRTVDLIDDRPSPASGRLGLQLHGGQEMAVEFKDIAMLVPVPAT